MKIFVNENNNFIEHLFITTYNNNLFQGFYLFYYKFNSNIILNPAFDYIQHQIDWIQNENSDLFTQHLNFNASVYEWNKNNNLTQNFGEPCVDLNKPVICFSGGGCRASAMAAGCLRYINVEGMWNTFSYITGLSGSSWANSLIFYQKASAKNPVSLDTILGEKIEWNTNREGPMSDNYYHEQHLFYPRKVLSASINRFKLLDPYVFFTALHILARRGRAWCLGVKDAVLEPFNLDGMSSSPCCFYKCMFLVIQWNSSI